MRVVCDEGDEPKRVGAARVVAGFLATGAGRLLALRVDGVRVRLVPLEEERLGLERVVDGAL